MWEEFNDRHPGCGKDKHIGVPVERPLEREEKAGPWHVGISLLWGILLPLKLKQRNGRDKLPKEAMISVFLHSPEGGNT
ncbi:unnamed protein product [Caretta caretta]